MTNNSLQYITPREQNNGMKKKKREVTTCRSSFRGYGVERHFQKYFSYIVAVSFSDGGNWST